ncbi:MAG: hypothetical protein JXM70_09590 [Pirellulales bacterium]|nr:hypothetical protein [Pirellulales bacterium]
MLNRRTWIRTAAGGISSFLLATFFAGPRHAQAAARTLDAETLKIALRVGRPEDKDFIDRIVDMMNTGKLPSSIVQKCFLWAKKKRKHKFQYFKRALIMLAASKNIVVK